VKFSTLCYLIKCIGYFIIRDISFLYSDQCTTNIQCALMRLTANLLLDVRFYYSPLKQYEILHLFSATCTLIL